MSIIWNHVRRSTAFDQSNVQRAWTNFRIGWQRHRAQPSKSHKQLVNRRFSKFRISRMRHAPGSRNLNPQRSFRSQSDAVLGRLAVDQIFAAVCWLTCRILVRHSRAQTVALFANYKQQSDVNTLLPQAFCGRNLRRDNALSIARASSVNASCVFGRRYERRNRIHVRGENNCRVRLFWRCGINVETIAFHRHSSCLVANAAKFSIEIISNCRFIARDRFNVDQFPRKRDSVHRKRITYSHRRGSELLQSCNLNAVTAHNSTIKSLFLEGSAGRLEALLNAGAENAAYAAVVCHPHPLFGGTLHNRVVFHTMKALNSFGFPVLRFNFRGAGLSHGEHDNGNGELDDVRTALDWLDAEFHLPLIFAGFSFGAAVGLRAACPDARVRAAIGVGTPVGPVVAGSEVPRTYTFEFLQDCPKPKLFVSGARDQFGPRAQLEALVASVPEPKKLVLIEGADHFFEGRLRELREVIEAWVKEAVSSQPSALS